MATAASAVAPPDDAIGMAHSFPHSRQVAGLAELAKNFRERVMLLVAHEGQRYKFCEA